MFTSVTGGDAENISQISTSTLRVLLWWGLQGSETVKKKKKEKFLTYCPINVHCR